ncbi:MAG: hypothetical protein K0S33_229 [Bacteroidetes bacterium]|nr:hypothetical protein [Bacteroidota bacterium]
MHKDYLRGEKEPYSGSCFLYFKSGQKQSEKVYLNGYVSAYHDWYENGNKKTEVVFDKKQLGVFGIPFVPKGIWWYENGQISEEHADGLHTTYFENGQKHTEEIYIGYKLKEWKEWDIKGKLIKQVSEPGHDWRIQYEALALKKDSVIIKPGKSVYKVSEEIKSVYLTTNIKWLRADGRCENLGAGAPLPILYKKTKKGYIKWNKSPRQLDCGAGTIKTSQSYNFSVYMDEPGTYKIAFEEYYLPENKTKLWFSDEFTVK